MEQQTGSLGGKIHGKMVKQKMKQAAKEASDKLMPMDTNSRASKGWEAQSLLNLHRARGGLPFQHQLLQVENRSLSRTPTLRYPSMDIDP